MTKCTAPAPTTNQKSDAITVASASLEIENIYNECPETTYLEAIMQWKDEHDFDEQTVSKYLSDALIHKLTNEAVNANLLKDKKATSYTLDFLS